MFIRLSNNARTFRYLTFFKLRIHQLFYSILDFFVNNENSFVTKCFVCFLYNVSKTSDFLTIYFKRQFF